jgi:hypothetical protein
MTDWFLPSGTPGSADDWCFRTVGTSDVRVFVDYQSYYSRLADLFAQMREGDEAFFVGWGFGLDVVLKNGVSALQHLKDAVRRKVRTRLLSTLKHDYNDNPAEVEKAKKVKVEALLDSQVHPDTNEIHRNHQKAVFIKLARSSHLFIGGMDVSTDRVGWMDVQAEVIGAGATLGRVTLEERWESVDPLATRIPTTQRATPTGDEEPRHKVQFVRTYPPYPTDEKTLRTWRRTYASNGDHTYYALLSRAIGAAKESIYLEEQFFWPMIKAPRRHHDVGGSKPRLRSDVPDIPATLEKMLAEAIGRGVKLVVIGPNYDDLPDWKKNREQVAKQLRNRKNPPLLLTVQPGMAFVHTKAWTFDDQFVLIGSANFWDKSVVSTLRPAEGEFGVGFTSTADGTALGFPKATFARALRVRMWERLIQSRHAGFKFPRSVDRRFEDEAKELTKPIQGKPVLIPM